MGHSCRKLLWDTLTGHSCGTLLWDTLVGHSCGTLLWDTLVGHSCRKLLWDTLTGHSWGTLLWDTLVGHSSRKLLQDTLVGHSCGTLLWNNVKRPSGSRRTRKSSAPKPSAKNAVDSSNLLLATSGLQSDLPVVAARARGPFFGATQRSGQLSIGKLTCQNLRQYTVNTNLRPNGHTRAYSPGKQNLFSNRGPLPKPTTKNQTTSNRLTQSQPFHVHPNQQTTSNRPTKKNG